MATFIGLILIFEILVIIFALCDLCGELDEEEEKRGK